MSFILFTRKVVSLSYTPYAHLTWGIELGLEAHWTILSRIGLVPRVIRVGLGLKATISCHLGKLGASFIPSYHEIVIDEYLHGSMDKVLTSRHCWMWVWIVVTYGASGRDVSWWFNCLWTYTWACVGGFLVKVVFLEFHEFHFIH